MPVYGSTVLPNLNPVFLDQSACDSQIAIIAGAAAPCLLGDNYPRTTAVVMHPLPTTLPTMPDVCTGVPADPWCSGQVSTVKGCVASARTRVTIDLGSRRGRRLRVGFVEHIKVGRHPEKISFTRIYRRCG